MDAIGSLQPNVVRQRPVNLNLMAAQEAANGSPRLLEIQFFDDATYVMEIQRAELNHSGGVSYAGRVYNSPFSPAVLVNNNGVVSIMVATADRRFNITGSPGIGYTAQEIGMNDPSDHPVGAFAEILLNSRRVSLPGPAQETVPTVPVAARDDGSTIDVMIIYTAAARTANGGVAQMNANVDAQISITNTIYVNSNAVQRLRLVYKGETVYTESTLSAGLNHVTATADGQMDDVPVLRDLYKADLVSVWGAFTDACGVGWLMSNENVNFAPNGYNTVTSPLCTGSGSYTFAHELGHNMGLNHDIKPDPGTTTTVTEAGTGTSKVIAYSRGHVDKANRFRTVMSYNDACVELGFDCFRVPYFSNPALTYNNQAFFGSAVTNAPLGVANNDGLTAAQQVANVSHEQRALDDTRETVANFRQPQLATLTGAGSFTFMASSLSVPEAGPSVVISVQRHIGTTGTVSVQYATANVTATAGLDYTATSGVLTFNDGETAKTITVPISQDAILEGTETFTVNLSNPTGGATLSSMSSITVRILDDEPDTFPAGGAFPPGFGTSTAPADWTVDTTDGYLSTASLRSANILAATQNVYVNSDLTYTGTFAAGNVTFALKMSTLATWGQFDFLIDGVVAYNNTGGGVDWTPLSIPVTAGNHTLTWRFKNRLNFECRFVSNPVPPPNCQDRVWVDGIVMPFPLTATSVSLGSSLNPSQTGQAVTFTANVSASSGTPTGNVDFRDGGVSIVGCNAVPLSAQSAQCATSALAQGTRVITANYLGSGTHAASSSASLNQTVNAAPVGPAKQNDLNGDQRSDLLWRNTADGAVQGWLMNGLSATQVAGLLPAGGYTITHVADLDGNGKADTLIKHTDGTTIGWMHDGLNVTGQATFFSAGSGWSIKHAADLNGDGKADLIVENTNGTVVGWLMNGLTVTATATFVPAGTGWSVSRVGDLNGDGKADLIWQNTNGTVQAWLMDGLSATQTATFVGAGTGWSVKLVGDFNADGKSDLVWQNTDGTVQAWLMNGTAITQIASFVPAGTGWSPVLAGDIDGDGRADLFWEHTDGRSQTWLMNGLSVSGIAGFVGAGGWRATHLLDLNGDGKRDVLWKHSTGTVQAWLMNGLTITQIASLAGAGTFEVIPPRP